MNDIREIDIIVDINSKVEHAFIMSIPLIPMLIDKVEKSTYQDRIDSSKVDFFPCYEIILKNGSKLLVPIESFEDMADELGMKYDKIRSFKRNKHVDKNTSHQTLIKYLN